MVVIEQEGSPDYRASQYIRDELNRLNEGARGFAAKVIFHVREAD